MSERPALAAEAVLVQSEQLPSDTPQISGYDFNNGVDFEAIMEQMLHTGFQATSYGQAVEEVRRMLRWRLSDEPPEPSATTAAKEDEEDKDGIGELIASRSGKEGEAAEEQEQDPSKVRARIFLGCTSNLVSSGVRESIRFLLQHKMIDCLVTTAGGVEEDLIKCLAPTFLGDFHLKGKDLRKRGLNRIGNMLVPNDNYCLFEDWIMPILDQMLVEQNEQGTKWTPSTMIDRLGKEIDNEESICYWAHKNNIPIFSPGLTDGSIGDMLYFHTFKNPGLIVDIVADIRRMNDQTVAVRPPRKTGMIILGGGLPKHHICNANLMRNGADFAVFLNTAQEFDGSDSGARPDEAVSWGKIRLDATPVKVYGDATLLFPLLVAQTFAKMHHKGELAGTSPA